MALSFPSNEAFAPLMPPPSRAGTRFHPAVLLFRFPAAASALLLVGCASGNRAHLPPPASATGAGELVDQARRVTAEKGLPAARDFLIEALAERDDSKGEMETRYRRTSNDKSLVYPDSLAALPPSRRARIGIAFIPGMRAKAGNQPSKPVQALRHASDEAERLGFQATLIPAIGRGRVDRNAAAMAESIGEVFRQSDQVILLGKSKGAHDLIYYLRHQGAALPPEQRAKLRSVVILAGTVQGSFVANWFARDPDAWALGTRLSMILSGKGSQIGMLKSVADSPWIGADERFLVETYPNLTWINLAVLPDGPDGRASTAEWSEFFNRHIRKSNVWESPSDSLVETAAEVLPATIEADEWIIRVLGTHAFPSGRFLDGSPITPGTPPLKDGTFNPAAGSEIINAFLRALPRSVVD